MSAREPTVSPIRIRGGVASLRKALLTWYDTQRRDWPWRRSRDPYRIWVAEVMLQQTRIAVVAPAYRRFVREFPTIRRLAHADEEAVLAAWSGLGYYTRARALYRAAQVLDERPNRSFPRDYAEALALPGVGTYTAAAVLSIAYGLPYAAVDGNVIRVLSRLARLEPGPSGNQAHRALAERILDRARPGDWNQALMELGQTICLPATPRCDACPVRHPCQARYHDDVTAHPAPRQRPPTERVRVGMLLLRDRSGNLLLERGAFPFLPHLWLPPTRVLDSASRGASLPRSRGRLVGTFRHAIMHRELSVDVYARVSSRAEIRREAGRPVGPGVERRLFDEAALSGIGRSSLLTKALRHAS